MGGWAPLLVKPAASYSVFWSQPKPGLFTGYFLGSFPEKARAKRQVAVNRRADRSAITPASRITDGRFMLAYPGPGSPATPSPQPPGLQPRAP